jgi:hypothetical protein
MDWSDKLQFYEALKKKGKLRDEDICPDVGDGENLILDIFNQLGSARSIGMDVGAIPITVLWEAQKHYNLNDITIHFLQILDVTFLRKRSADIG